MATPQPRPGQPVRYADVPSLPGMVAINPVFVRLCEGRYGITRREWRLLACAVEGGIMTSAELAAAASWTWPARRARWARCARRAGCAGCTTAPTGAWSGRGHRARAGTLPGAAARGRAPERHAGAGPERDRGRAAARLPGAHRATRPAHGRGQHRVRQGQPARRRHPPGEVEAPFNGVSTKICYARRLPSAQPRHGRPRPPRPQGRPGAPTDHPCPASRTNPSSVVSKA